MIKDMIDKLNTDDIYSMSMFMLYKLIDDPEYSALAELPYLVDRKSLLSLCTCFGGHTIKIPTIRELYSIMHVIILYQYVHNDNISFEEAFNKLGYKTEDVRKLRHIYNKLSKVLEKYEFKHREKI